MNNLILKTFLNSIALTFVIIFVLNLIAVLIALYNTDMIGSWSFKLFHGTFAVDGNPVGLQFGSMKTTIYMLIIFSALFFNAYRKDNLKVSK